MALFICHWGAHFLSTICYIFILSKTLLDEELKTYYIRVAIGQPIGDYGWTTVWAWYKSDAEKYEEIRRIVLEALNDEKVMF